MRKEKRETVGDWRFRGRWLEVVPTADGTVGCGQLVCCVRVQNVYGAACVDDALPRAAFRVVAVGVMCKLSESSVERSVIAGRQGGWRCRASP